MDGYLLDSTVRHFEKTIWVQLTFKPKFANVDSSLANCPHLHPGTDFISCQMTTPHGLNVKKSVINSSCFSATTFLGLYT